MTQPQRTATIKVGLLTIISLTVLVTTLIWLRGRALGGGQTFDVYFKDVDGLREGAPVQLMGIRAGFIDDVLPVVLPHQQFRVKIRFTLNDQSLHIPKGSYLSLQQSGLIGEKFLEITPPRTQSMALEFPQLHQELHSGMPIKVRFRDGLSPVGYVVDVLAIPIPRVTRQTPDYEYRLQYIINRPGYFSPKNMHFKLMQDRANQKFLVLDDSDSQWQRRPTEHTYFTLEEPLRLKTFLEEQLASAESLKETNDKINRLLSTETIATIQKTFRNSERLTAEATSVLHTAQGLFASTSQDMKTLVGSAQRLTDSVASVSRNINTLTGDPALRGRLQETAQSLSEATTSLAKLLKDPNLQTALSDVKVTSENAAEITQYLKTTVVDNDLQGKLNHSITALNTSLDRLSVILADVESVSSDKQALRGILQDTRNTSANLNAFSEKLNKHFLFFRLLF